MSTATVRSREATAPARPRHQPAPVRRHLRPVPDTAPARAPSGRRRLRPHVALTMAIFAFFVILFGVALLQTVLVQGQIHLDGVRTDLVERQAEVQAARADVAQLSSPENIIRAARDLGLTEVPHRFVSSPPEAEPTAP